MEYETNKILEISLAKIDRKNASRKQSTASSTLHRNLLVSSVLKAIKPDGIPGKDILMDYRETKVIDLDIDEANFEKETCFVRSNFSRKTISVESVGVEWKPRGCSEPCDLKVINNSDCEMHEISKKSEESCTDVNSNWQKMPGQENSMLLLETLNNSSSDLRNSLSFKRPRDSDFDMSHMPRPNKICRIVNNESCDEDTQAVTFLETLFRDSFNEFRDQASYDRPLNFATFPLVSVMAC